MPAVAPNYTKHRTKVTAADSAALTDVKSCINMDGFADAHVQVIPSGGANPTVEVLWWSDAASKFIKEQVALTKAGIGADTPYEFTVSAKGRKMLVAVTTIAAGQCDVYVAGFNQNSLV